MEIELARCDCCGLVEECTQEYIAGVKSRFGGKWLCGLCSQAVADEADAGGGRGNEGRLPGMESALDSHMSFCRKFNLNPAIQVADGMKQMLRRRAGGLPRSPSSSSSSSSTAYARSITMPRLRDKSSLALLG